MKYYAVILAGGVGTRMGSDIPKQFLVVNGKPIIVHSIENFQKNSSIESILIVCVKGWIKTVEKLVKDFCLTKVKWVIEGGSCGHDSIRNGIFFLKDKIEGDDLVVIHDAVRPILPQRAIDNVIAVAEKYGNASSSIICHAPIVYTENHIFGETDIDREKVMLTQAPQAFKYSLVYDCYKKAEEENKHDFTYTSSLIIYYGYRVYFAEGTTCNIKITKKEDLPLFKALLMCAEDIMA